MIISWQTPIKTVSEANSSEHWTKKLKRHKQQQFFTRLGYQKHVKEMKLPCIIRLIRLSPRLLDDEDNLPMAFKWIKDELGACIFPGRVIHYLSKKGAIKQNKGHCDDDKRISWKYGQEKAKRQGVRFEIEH